MLSFIDFVHKFQLETKPTLITKIQHVLSSLSLNDVGIYSRDWPFSSDVGIVNLQPFHGTQWVEYINETLFESYGCASPQKLTKFIIKRKGHCLFSDYRIQGLANKWDSFSASYSLFIFYLTIDLAKDLIPAVLILYYQTTQWRWRFL